MKEQTYVNKELRLISRYRGLRQSRIVLAVLLLAALAVTRPVPLYFFLLLCVFPVMLRQALASSARTRSMTLSVLTETAAKYRFSYPSYLAESYCIYLLAPLFLVWQYTFTRAAIPFPKGILPITLPAAYLLCRITLSLFYYLRMRHDFLSLKIEL